MTPKSPSLPPGAITEGSGAGAGMYSLSTSTRSDDATKGAMGSIAASIVGFGLGKTRVSYLVLMYRATVLNATELVAEE